MMQTVRTVAVFVGILLAAAFAVLLVNQTREFVAFAGGFHPVAGRAVLWGLVALYATCLAVPAILILRLPKAISPPTADEEEAIARHVEVLAKRMRGNPHVAGMPLETRDDMEAAIHVLDARAEDCIRHSGSRVFLTTAISQNGSLDSLIVLALQTRMVWRIAHVYFQRPSVRDMAWLYTNVAATAFLAAELDDAELAEQIQPVLSQVLGSATVGIPGLQGVTNVFVNSVFTGTANAFLTLRVGVIARRYCGALVRPERRTLRRAALAEAAGLLGGIATRGVRDLSVAFARASTQRMGKTVRGLGGRMTGAARRTGSAMSDAVRKTGSAMGEAIRPPPLPGGPGAPMEPPAAPPEPSDPAGADPRFRSPDPSNPGGAQ